MAKGRIDKVQYKMNTLYVHSNSGHITSIHLGGDYLDITDKLDQRDRKWLYDRLNLRFIEEELAMQVDHTVPVLPEPFAEVKARHEQYQTGAITLSEFIDSLRVLYVSYPDPPAYPFD